MTKLIRFDHSDAAPAQRPGTEGFGMTPPLAPPRPDTALTALVTAMTLAVCIALTATMLTLGRAHSEHAIAGDVIAAQPTHPAAANIRS